MGSSLDIVTNQVHESQVIGELGKGYKYAIETLNLGRIGIGAQVRGSFVSESM